MIVGVTGATGFIGKLLVKRHLENGDTVRILTRKSKITGMKSIQVFTANLLSCTPETLIPFVDNLDVLYHCAGELSDKNRMYDLHVTGTEKLIQAAKNRVGRWVQLSSVGVYGEFREGVVTEDTPNNPQGLYEQTKAASDDLVQQAGEEKAFETVILRSSNVFGLSMKNQSLFDLINNIYKKMFFFIGKNDANINYVHVDNVVAGLMLCASAKNVNQRIDKIHSQKTLAITSR